MKLKPGLYIVSTPIGNLEDITLRALKVLKHSDLVFCEDTRISNRLLVKHDIKATLRVYNDNSDESARRLIKTLVKEGKVVSLVSDAGTPLISDPGFKLVRDLKNEGLFIDIIPGPCAAVAALTLSGLPTDKFYFAGFLPKTEQNKIHVFKEIMNLECTVIFYETAVRLLQSLKIAYEILGNRPTNVARELTKLYQESNTASLKELISYYSTYPPKGEIVLGINGAEQEPVSIDEMQAEISSLIKQKLSARTVSDLIFAKYRNYYSRNEIYKIVNEIKHLEN
jgi:16S rRNA (cytidine1402-2'-O)-methyltransferase